MTLWLSIRLAMPLQNSDKKSCWWWRQATYEIQLRTLTSPYPLCVSIIGTHILNNILLNWVVYYSNVELTLLVRIFWQKCQLQINQLSVVMRSIESVWLGGSLPYVQLNVQGQMVETKTIYHTKILLVFWNKTLYSRNDKNTYCLTFWT
jgi:hypothetical protein